MQSPKPSQRYLQRRRQSLPAVLHSDADSDGEEGGDGKAAARRQKPIAEEETVMSLSHGISDFLKNHRKSHSASRPWFLNAAAAREGSTSPRPSTSGRGSARRRGSADMLTLTARFKALKDNPKSSIARPGNTSSNGKHTKNLKSGANKHLQADDEAYRSRANSWSPVPVPRGSKNSEGAEGDNCSGGESDSPPATPPASYMRGGRRHSIDVVSNLGTPRRSILKTPRSGRRPHTIWDTTFDEAAGMGMSGAKPGMYGNLNFSEEANEPIPDGSDAFQRVLQCYARNSQQKADVVAEEEEQVFGGRGRSDSDTEIIYSRIQESVPDTAGDSGREGSGSSGESDGDTGGVPSRKKHVHFRES